MNSRHYVCLGKVANNITACYSVAKLTLKVIATNIPPAYNIAPKAVCDDFLDIDGNNNVNNNKRDGATFDLSATKTIKIYYQQQPVFTISIIIEIKVMH
jgi:hypothetical protein